MTRRIEKINELLKEVVSGIILREVSIQDDVLVTVTRVVTSPDLHYANVFVTIFSAVSGADKTALVLLKNKTVEIQRALNRKLRMRPVPRIAFVVDEGEGKRERIEKLLAQEKGRN